MEKVLQNKGKRGCPRIAQEFCRIAREAGRQLFGSRVGAAGVPFWGNFCELSGSLFGPVWKEFRCIPGVAPELPGGGEILTSSIVLCFLLLFCIFSSIFLSGGPGALRSCPEASPGRLPSLSPRPLKYIFGNNFQASLQGDIGYGKYEKITKSSGKQRKKSCLGAAQLPPHAPQRTRDKDKGQGTWTKDNENL